MSGVRFAPSPTGSFHLGNLRTAWVSRRMALLGRIPWVVRFEDIDELRSKPGAKQGQLDDLSALGLTPDLVIDQSARHSEHLAAFEAARAEGKVYPCDCSRANVQAVLAQVQSAPHTGESYQYSGHCRNHRRESLAEYHPRETLARRWARADDPSGRSDAIVARTGPDGSEFAPGYHWACAIDDADGDYSLLVRAWDLAPAELMQAPIRRWRNPRSNVGVFHTSLVTLDSGDRLEKRTQRVTLAELLANGWSPARLLAAFEASFSPPDRLDTGGEDRKVLPLSELLPGFGTGI